MSNPQRIDYGIDAPAVLRNLFVVGITCLLLAAFGPRTLQLGSHLSINLRITMLWTGGAFTVEACLFLLYVKYGKFKHRDFLLGMHAWRGDEQVLDIGCGRGLLLIGAAKRLTAGHATGIDIWSTTDLSGNAFEAAERNLQLEGVADRCTLISGPAQSMPFADASFDVIVSNLCLHNIDDRPTRGAALDQIVRVLKPGGTALLSDYKLTGEYLQHLHNAGFAVSKKRGSLFTTFPPLRVVLAHKPT